MATAHPLVGENGFVQFEQLFTFLSLQTLFESERLTASTKGYSYFKGSGLFIAKRGCVTRPPPTCSSSVGMSIE